MALRAPANALLLAVLGLSLGACTTLGPDYEKPAVDVQPEWIEPDSELISAAASLDPRWWQGAFEDPDLNALIDKAMGQNLTLRSAGLRVLQSQQQLAIAIGDQYPQQQQINAGAMREQENNERFNDYNVGFNLAWELDFWGRFSRQIESAAAELDASVANYDDAMVELISQVAQSYLVLRTQQLRLQIAEANITLQEESLRLARAKFEAGDTSELDVDQAESLLYNTRASVPGFQTSVQQAKNALAILLAETPQEFNDLATSKAQLPDVKASIALGMPQDLIRQRPDVRSAERQLAAQSARIGFAITDLYPHLSIGGSIGTSAMESEDLFSANGEAWSVFGTFEWDVLNYGRLTSNVRLQDAIFQQLLEDYRLTVLQAQVDVENAVVAYINAIQQVRNYQAAVDASLRAVEVSTAQYQNGLLDYDTVITSLNSLRQQQDILASARGSVTTNLVQIYRSLGGGWQIREDRDPVELLPESTREEMRGRTDYWDDKL